MSRLLSLLDVARDRATTALAKLESAPAAVLQPDAPALAPVIDLAQLRPAPVALQPPPPPPTIPGPDLTLTLDPDTGTIVPTDPVDQPARESEPELEPELAATPSSWVPLIGALRGRARVAAGGIVDRIAALLDERGVTRMQLLGLLVAMPLVVAFATWVVVRLLEGS